jgi:hypothetical protein
MLLRYNDKKGTSNDLQNTGQKTKDRATHSPLKASAPEGLAVSTALMTLVVLLTSDGLRRIFKVLFLKTYHGGLVYSV